MPGNTILYCHEDLFDVVCRSGILTITMSVQQLKWYFRAIKTL